MSRTVYLNGQFVPEAEAKLSIYDLSVMQAAAAFTMTRSFNGRHFKLDAHMRRLEQSCQLLHIPLPVSVSELEGLCYEVSARNDHGPGEEHRLLIVVSPGCAPMYRDLDGVIPHPFVYIADFPLRYTVKGFGTYFTDGVRCVTSKVRQIPDTCIPSAAKHRSRLHFHLAQQQAQAGWPLLKTVSGRYCEAPGANIVLVRNGYIRFLSESALPGISMQTVKELTRKYHPPFFDDWLTWWHKNEYGQSLDAIDEMFLTGTPFCALPVVELDGKPIGTGKPGPVYRDLMQKWNALVGLDIAEQIIRWDSTD